MKLIERINARLPLPAVLAERSLLIALVLALVAGLTQWILWLGRDELEFDTFVGPPRSDYTLETFTLTSYDETGAFAFAVDAPRLAKHPYVGSFEIDTPKFRIRDAKGLDWKARSNKAFVSGDANELKLTGAVELDRPEQATTGPLAVRSEELTARVDTNTVTSQTAVTIEQPGSILQGNGLQANLDTRRFKLERGTKSRFLPKAARPSSAG